MLRALFTLFGLAAVPLALATPLLKTAPYTDPRPDGGSMLDSSAGLGEPLNVSELQSPYTTVVVIKLLGCHFWPLQHVRPQHCRN